MDVIFTFAVISGIIILGFISELIFKKFNIPDVIILIGTGIIIGSVLNWTDASSFGGGENLFTTFALLFILFQGALNIEFKTLFKSLSSTVKLTSISFFLTVFVVTIISYFMGYDLLPSILIGTILGGTSSAVVIPIVENLDIKNKYGLVLTLESALSDVLCIVGTITVIQIIESGEIVASAIFRSLLSSFSLALFVGLIFGFIWILVLSHYENLTKSYMVTIAALIGLYSFVESDFVQASGAIAALSFGLMLGNSKLILEMMDDKRRRRSNTQNEDEIKNVKTILSSSAKTFYFEISFFVKVFFFVYLGLLIDFSNYMVFIYGGILTLIIFLIRPFAVNLVFKNENLEEKERIFLEVLIPKGLAAAVLVGVAVQMGVFGDKSTEIVNIILSVVLISIFLTSILVFLTERSWFKGFLPIFNKNN